MHSNLLYTWQLQAPPLSFYVAPPLPGGISFGLPTSAGVRRLKLRKLNLRIVGLRCQVSVKTPNTRYGFPTGNKKRGRKTKKQLDTERGT